jgi:hypothetical protein
VKGVQIDVVKGSPHLHPANTNSIGYHSDVVVGLRSDISNMLSSIPTLRRSGRSRLGWGN